MYFWSAVSAVAGALRRKVWIDERMFKWYANMYLILVAPPGIVSKSTTAELSMDILRQVPGIQFGPSVVTWQSLVQTFGKSAEQFEHSDGTWEVQSPLTVVSSEFGNLLDPNDKQMVDILVHLWDGRSFQKATKGSGNDDVQNPWLNIIACTTPDWIAGNFPEYAIGGGFTSRCLFVYAGEKANYVAYPSLVVPGSYAAQREALVSDLCHISEAIAGPFSLSSDARAWGAEWYERHYKVDATQMDSSRFGGYAARKQTHVHKLAMVLSASRRDDRIIDLDTLQTSVAMVTGLEAEMQMVFAKIGMSKESVQIDRFVLWVERQGAVSMASALRFMQAHFPFRRDFNDIIATCIGAGQLHLKETASGTAVAAGPETRGIAPA